MPNYRRLRIPGGSFFFTVNLLNRRRTLLVDRVDSLRDAFRKEKAIRPFHIDAIVILPDHLHCIWTLAPGDDDFSTRWRRIKADFSRSLPNTENRSASRRGKGERGIWQRRFWEHAIRDDADFAHHVDYIHFNPVKHGHVERPSDWAFSSLHSFIRLGVIDEDWGVGGIGFDADLG